MTENERGRFFFLTVLRYMIIPILAIAGTVYFTTLFDSPRTVQATGQQKQVQPVKSMAEIREWQDWVHDCDVTYLTKGMKLREGFSPTNPNYPSFILREALPGEKPTAYYLVDHLGYCKRIIQER